MPSSNLQKLVEGLADQLKANPEQAIQALLGKDKKAALIYRMSKGLIDIDGIVKKELDKLTVKTPEQWRQFEDLIVGVIDGEDAATNVAREFLRGVVNV